MIARIFCGAVLALLLSSCHILHGQGGKQVFVQAAQSNNDCPPHSARPSPDALCICDEDYKIAGAQCVPEDDTGGPPVSNDCPDNSARPSSGTLCICDEGYEIAGAVCLEKLADCPMNSARPTRADACECINNHERVGADCLAILPPCPNNGARPTPRAICVCDDGFDPMGALCVPEDDTGGPPVSNDCPDNSARPSSGTLCICDDGYEIAGAVCLPKLAACPDRSARPTREDACECIGGYERVGADCLAILPRCQDNAARITPRGVCVCDNGYEAEGELCLLILADCPDKSSRPSREEECQCDSGYEKVGAECLEELPDCPDRSSRPAQREECECDTGYEMSGDECILMCGENEINNAGTCECSVGYERPPGGGACFHPFDTAEYRRNPFLDYINPLYAYHQGYLGQSVTIFMVEDHRDGCILEAHEDLADRLVDRSFLTIIEDDTRFACDEDYESTEAAGIAAATRNEKGAHGVAPEATVFPLRQTAFIFSGGGFSVRFPEINERAPDGTAINAKIISYGASYGPSTHHFAGDTRYNEFIEFADNFELPFQLPPFIGDAVYVWEGGGGGFNGMGQRENNFIQPGLPGLLPVVIQRHEVHFLVAVGVYRSADGEFRIENRNRHDIRLNPNGCGPAANWCVSAPVEAAHPGGPDGAYTDSARPENAAPYVSGALAILRSANFSLRMSVIRAVLLTTATDIGEEGIDELYGWGLINVSAAVRHIEEMETAEMDSLPGIKLRDLKTGLPDGFRHLAADMKNISVAVKVTDNSFVNMALSELLPPGANSPPAIGDAAGDMFAAETAEKRRGFAAFADSSSGAYKLSWSGGAGKTQIGGELRHYAKDKTFTNMGALGGANGMQNGGKIRLKRGIFGGLAAFGEYEYAAIKAKTKSGKLLSEIKGAQLEGWTAGMEFADMWQKGGRLIFSARQAKRLSGGELIIRRPLAEGEFYDAFLGKSEQRITESESSLRLKSDAPLIWTAGYAMTTQKGKWSAAAEHTKGKTAISAQWIINL